MSFKKEMGTIMELLATVWIQKWLQLAFAVQPMFSKLCDLNGKRFFLTLAGSAICAGLRCDCSSQLPRGQRGNKEGVCRGGAWQFFPPLHQCDFATPLIEQVFVSLPLVTEFDCVTYCAPWDMSKHHPEETWKVLAHWGLLFCCWEPGAHPLEKPKLTSWSRRNHVGRG